MTLMESAQLLGNFGEFFGAIAVVVTLVYLATQIRQNSKMMKSAALQKAIDDRTSITAMLVDLPHVWRVGLGTYESLTDDEKVQFNGIMLSMISSHMGLRGLFEDGSLDAQTFELFENDLTSAMICPGVRDWWGDTQGAYLIWAEYINQLIARRENRSVPLTESFPFLRPTPH